MDSGKRTVIFRLDSRSSPHPANPWSVHLTRKMQNTLRLGSFNYARCTQSTLLPARGLEPRVCANRSVGIVGAPYLAACEGKIYWELRILAATGWVFVGFAGTNFRSGPQSPQYTMAALLGDDEASCPLYVDDGKRINRLVVPPIPPPSQPLHHHPCPSVTLPSLTPESSFFTACDTGAISCGKARRLAWFGTAQPAQCRCPSTARHTAPPSPPPAPSARARLPGRRFTRWFAVAAGAWWNGACAGALASPHRRPITSLVLKKR
jgi:hypothetical protein